MLLVDSDLNVEAALNWNERQLGRAKTSSVKPMLAVDVTEWERIEAFLNRVEDTGGMLTVEALYQSITVVLRGVLPFEGVAPVASGSE